MKAQEFPRKSAAIYHFTNRSEKRPCVYQKQLNQLKSYAEELGYIVDHIYCDFSLKVCEQVEKQKMSQMATLDYAYNRDFKNPEFKEKVKEIFRNTNTAIHDIPQAKGLGMAGNCGMRVKKDFSTALKNGLAKGERQITYYKRDYPLMVPSRLFSIYSERKEYTDTNGTIKETTGYFIKFPNHIRFEICMGSHGKKNKQLISTLTSICNPEDTSVSFSDSTVSLVGNEIILNLNVKRESDSLSYSPEKGRVMGVAFDYNRPCVAYITDIDKYKYIGNKYCSRLIQDRIKIQNMSRELSIDLRSSSGGRGRSKKLKAKNQYKNHEKNVRNHYNHHISVEIVNCAIANRVETIAVQKLSINEARKAPVVLRNWSNEDLINKIKYKAARFGINVIEVDSHLTNSRCSSCGAELTLQLESDLIWIDSITVNCTHCGSNIDYSENSAKNATKYI